MSFASWAWTTISDIHGENLEAHYDPPSIRKYPRVFPTLDMTAGKGSAFIKTQKNGFCLALKSSLEENHPLLISAPSLNANHREKPKLAPAFLILEDEH